MNKSKETLRLRKAMCFRIAESLAEDWPSLELEIDEVAEELDRQIPLSYEESEAEYDEAPGDETPLPRGPSMFGKLREALHYSDGCSIQQAMELATERVKQRDELLAACKLAVQEPDGIMQANTWLALTASIARAEAT